MGEESWPENVVRTLGIVDSEMPLDDGLLLGEIVRDGPRPIICADCGKSIVDGFVVHMKPEVYAVWYKDETFYLERHIGVSCGCAAKRGFV